MNREIKFRGKRLDNKEWIYGYFRYIDGQFFITNDGTCPVEHQIFSETLGEYTNSSDKNNKKIYEGDIIQGVFGANFYQKGVIKFDTRHVQFQFFNPKLEEDSIPFYSMNKKEIIGNIFDNSKLLK